jgi:ubiquinone/menaquinone biosynthesis C-methylase UbiE
MSPLSSGEVKAFFDRVASDWDTMRIAYYDERVIERMATFAAVDESMTVLDVGTGTGFVAAGLAPRVAHVIGVDAAPEMLGVARGNLDELGVGNVELREADVARLPLDDDSVDAAFANMVLHHAEDPAAMLAEMARVVRPGGAVAICDEVEHPYEWMRAEHADVWLGFTTEQVAGFFASAGLEQLSIESLGMQ